MKISKPSFLCHHHLSHGLLAGRWPTGGYNRLKKGQSLNNENLINGVIV